MPKFPKYLRLGIWSPQFGIYCYQLGFFCQAMPIPLPMLMPMSMPMSLLCSGSPSGIVLVEWTKKSRDKGEPSSIRNNRQPIWIRFVYNKNVQSCVKWIELRLCTTFSLYMDRSLYEYHQTGRSISCEPSLFELADGLQGVICPVQNRSHLCQVAPGQQPVSPYGWLLSAPPHSL